MSNPKLLDYASSQDMTTLAIGYQLASQEKCTTWYCEQVLHFQIEYGLNSIFRPLTVVEILEFVAKGILPFNVNDPASTHIIKILGNTEVIIPDKNIEFNYKRKCYLLCVDNHLKILVWSIKVFSHFEKYFNE